MLQLAGAGGEKHKVAGRRVFVEFLAPFPGLQGSAVLWLSGCGAKRAPLTVSWLA